MRNQSDILISKGNHSFTIDINTWKAFIAILLVSGCVGLPRQPIYWEHNEDTPNTTVSSLLSRNRFGEIMQNFHLADNSNLDKEEKFAKVRPLIDKLNEQCLANYLSEQSVSINESMVPYFGHHGCKQYMRNKPVRFGYKFWVAATPLCYAIQFSPYTDSSLGLGGSVVANLTEKLPSQVGFNYHIIMDSFFTSPNLLRILKAKGIATEMLLGHRSKKWWWPVLRFCLDLSVNNHISCTISRSALKENASWIYWDFGEVLLIHIIDIFEN